MSDAVSDDRAALEVDARAEKTIESMKQSAVNRAQLIKQFGFIPLSVLDKLHRGKLSRAMFHYQAELGKSTGKGKRAEKLGGIFHSDRALRISGGGSRTKDGHAWSVMPAELVEFFVKYYAKPGDMYLDPFAGQGVQMQVALMLGLHYFAYDLCEEFVEFCIGVRDKIASQYPGLDVDVELRDSKHPDTIANNIGDFCFTSPPYWDIEFYGNDPNQLGTDKTYEEFLQGMEIVARAWLPKFKDGAYCVINVNDFRKDGVFYPYHADTIGCYTRAGWTLTDTWIIPHLVGGLPKVFAAESNLRRVAPKVHEYALVFRKLADEAPSNGTQRRRRATGSRKAR